MTTYVVADGIVAKRKPTPAEHELFFGTRLPELIIRFTSGGVDPAGVNTTLKQVSDGVVITESKTVVITSPKPKREQPDKFEYLKSFDVTVPEGYDHATRLDTFRAAHQSEENKEFYFYNDAITDANYAGKATTKLTAGRQFTVKVFGITERVTSEDCLAKLRSEKAVLVGAHGASLAYEQKKDELPKGKWSVSFDEKKALWRDSDGDRGVPSVRAYSGGDFRFDLGRWEGDWGSGNVLLCFCDKLSDSMALDA